MGATPAPDAAETSPPSEARPQAACVRVVLLSLQSLLADPTALDAAHPANAAAAALLRDDADAFERRARRDAVASLEFYDTAHVDDEEEDADAPEAAGPDDRSIMFKRPRGDEALSFDAGRAEEALAFDAERDELGPI